MRITLTCPMVELSGNHNAASNLALDSKSDGYGIGPLRSLVTAPDNVIEISSIASS